MNCDPANGLCETLVPTDLKPCLERGCSEYGITLLHRPVRQPHFGGHIDRLIGTMMDREFSHGVILVVLADPGRFLISFLPVIRHRLQPYGLFFERIRYWSHVLPTIAQPHDQLIVRYDPRDL